MRAIARSKALALAAVAVLVAFAAWEGLQSRQSAAAHWSVGVAIVLGAASVVVAGRGRQPTTSGAWLASAARAARRWRRDPRYAAGVAVWTLLFLAVVGWDMNSFIHEVHDLPTLSYLVGRVTRFEWGRALLCAVWLAAGVGLVSGCLVRRRRPRAGR